MWVPNPLLPPAGQPSWPASADSPGAPSRPRTSSDCWWSWRSRYPATSLSPACRFSTEGQKSKSKEGSPDISETGEKLSAAVQPFCEGPDLPKLQLLFGHPGLHGDGSGQLGRLLLLGPQRTGAQAFPLRRRRFCLREANRLKFLFFFNVPRLPLRRQLPVSTNLSGFPCCRGGR